MHLKRYIVLKEGGTTREGVRRVRWRRLDVRPLRPIVPLAALFVVIAGVYRAWFGAGVVTAGDFPYFTPAHLLDGIPFPSLWDSTSSIGGYNILNAPMFPLAVLQGVLASFNIDWSLSERLLWIIPSVAVPSASTYVLSLSLFRQRLAACISSVAVVMNSYVYLLYEGGQIGVAVAYGCIPLVLWAFLRGQRRGTAGSFVLTGLLMAVQAMYDIRSTYLTLGVLAMYGCFCCLELIAHRTDTTGVIEGDRFLLKTAGVPQMIVALVVLGVSNLWWILPALFVRAPQLPSGYADVAGVRPLSYMRLGNGMALFHPFWFANNLRINPIDPLFFVAPLLLFGLLSRRCVNRPVVFLTALALVATFFVKGDNDPVGGVYDWFFVHLPGFLYLRDPSKFYQPLALAYALLLGVMAAHCSRLVRRVGTAQRRWRPAVVAIAFLAVAAFPAYPALTQQARGAFVVGHVPTDYARFNAFVDHQRDFFRVLWVPARPRFGTLSALHPALDAAVISACCIKTVSATNRSWSWLRSSFAAQTLRALSVRYVVVPVGASDADFIGQPTAIADITSPTALAAVRTVLSPQRERTIGRLHIFSSVGNYPPIFATHNGRRASGAGMRCAYETFCVGAPSSTFRVQALPQAQASPPQVVFRGRGSSYDVHLQATGTPIYLVLQQTYDPNWLAFVERDQEPFHWWMIFLQHPLPSIDHGTANGYANVWIIHTPGTYHIVLEYWPQRLVVVGLFLASMALLIGGILASIHVFKKRIVLSLIVEGNS